MKKIKLALYAVVFLFTLLLVPACNNGSGGITNNSGNLNNGENDQMWTGDNMEDFLAEGLTVSDKGSGIYERTPYDERLVGVAYTTWHRDGMWGEDNIWAEPLLGKYRSDDSDIIEAHGKMLGEADVDFVFVDWSNNVSFNESEYPRATYDNIMNEKKPGITGRPDFAMIERATVKMFDVWSGMDEKTPQIAIMIGCPDRTGALTDGGIQKKADQVYDWFLVNKSKPQFAEKYMSFNGKPLLIVYLGTPTFVIDKDPLEIWDDDRFTVRYITGFVTQQPYLTNTDSLESKYGYWSWEDRGAQTFAVDSEKNQPEAMTVVASYRAQGEPGDAGYIPASGRRGGLTFKEGWARARLIGVKTVLVVSWNEYVLGEQINAEISKDIEPNTVYGDEYYNMLKDEIKKFKGKK